MTAELLLTAAEPPQCLPPLESVRGSLVRYPEGARYPEGTCDTHAHVFGAISSYPLIEPRGYTPTVITLDDYDAVMSTFGIERAVVQPSVYGLEERALLNALAGTLGQTQSLERLDATECERRRPPAAASG